MDNLWGSKLEFESIFGEPLLKVLLEPRLLLLNLIDIVACFVIHHDRREIDEPVFNSFYNIFAFSVELTAVKAYKQTCVSIIKLYLLG